MVSVRYSHILTKDACFMIQFVLLCPGLQVVFSALARLVFASLDDWIEFK